MVQLLAKGGFGASHGCAHAARGKIESGGDIGVAETAVPQYKGDGLPAGQPRQRRPYPPALIADHDRIGDVGRHPVTPIRGLLTAGATTSGADMVQRRVRRRDRQPAQGLAGRHRGAPERQEHLLSHILGLVPGAEHAGRDGDDPRIGGAEDLFEVSSDGPSLLRSRRLRSRHGHPVLPPDPAGHRAVPVTCQGDRRTPTVHYEVHICGAPPAPRM